MNPTPPQDEARKVADKLTDAHARVLEALGPEDDFGYYCYRDLSIQAGLPNDKALRQLVRELRDLGAVRFSTGLMTDDGTPYGSGHAYTVPFGLEVRNLLLEGNSHG